MNTEKTRLHNQKAPSVSVIVVTHEHKNCIDNCLLSVFAQKGVLFEVILVDNASRDGTAAHVKHWFSQIKIISQKHRFGLATNINAGIKISSGKHIVILNPDTYMYPNALCVLVQCLERNPKIGICGPMLVNTDGSIQMSYRNFPTWKTVFFRRTPIRYCFPHARAVQEHLNIGKNHYISRKVDWMLGACLCVRRTVFNDMGLFDEKYRLYVEDIDFCLRAHIKGWEVWYEPKAIVMHQHEAKSDHALLSIYSYYHLTSMIHYGKKYWRMISGIEKFNNYTISKN